MGYYENLQIMNAETQAMIKAMGDQGIAINDLILNITTRFPVSDKAIIKRVHLLKDVGMVKIEDGFVIWMKN